MKISLTNMHVHYFIVIIPIKNIQHENLSYKSFITRKFPDLQYMYIQFKLRAHTQRNFIGSFSTPPPKIVNILKLDLQQSHNI